MGQISSMKRGTFFYTSVEGDYDIPAQQLRKNQT